VSESEPSTVDGAPSKKLRLFPPGIEPGSEGFTAQNDIFQRKPLAIGLTTLLRSVADPLVVAVDGPWGCGKTTFLKTWAETLKAESYPTIVFDAFEHDYFDDPFMAIAGEIIALSTSTKSARAPTDKLTKKAKAVGKVLLRSSLKVGVSLASAGALKAEGFEEIAKEVASEITAVTDKYLGELLTKAAEQKSAIADFKQALSELPTMLQNASADPKPLIIIIDELDRCRPPFALQLLERIKHFLSVPNVHFVFGVHLPQLANAARLTYGAELDAHLYLQKFIHLTIPLVTTVDDSRGLNDCKKYIGHLFSKLDLGADARTLQLIEQYLLELSINRNLTFRTIERIGSNIAIAMAVSENMLRIPPIIVGLCALKVLEPPLFAKAKGRGLTLKEVRDALRIGDKSWATDWWRYALGDEMPDEELNRFRQALFRYDLSREDIVPFTANTIIDGFARLT
jgi:energy-coupling factor transporter ATP-binding protein EcfA2